jgi:hypothetical protein
VQTDQTNVQQMANDNSKWGGGQQTLGWASELQKLQKQMDEAQSKFGQMTRMDVASGPRRQFVDVDRNKQRYDSYKAEYDALQQKMQRYLQDQYKNVYGGDQSAMAGAMNNFWGDNSNVLTRSRSLPTPEGGFKVGDRVSYQVPMYGELSQQGQADMYRQEYGDEYGYIQDMLKQMWGG